MQKEKIVDIIFGRQQQMREGVGMSKKRCGATLAICIFTVSCSTLPVVEETTGFTAADIARKVRCELRDAIEDKVAVWIAQAFPDDAYVNEIVPLLKYDAITLRGVDEKRLPSEARIYIAYFMKTAVAYDFNLGISETNDADAGLDLIGILTGNTIKLGVSSGVNRIREHEQSFYIVETFKHLTKEVNDDFCDAKRKPDFFNNSPNIAYPIAGRINIKKPLDEFVDLSLFASLSNKKASDGPPTLTSAITFTTKIYGNATPEIAALPALTKASLSAKNSRQDIHKVVVAFSIPEPPPVLSNARVETFVRTDGTKAEKAAAAAINNYKSERKYIIVNNR